MVVFACIVTIALVSMKTSSFAKKEAFEKTEHIVFRDSSALQEKVNHDIGEMAYWSDTFTGKRQGIIKQIADNYTSVGAGSEQLSNILEELLSGAEDTSQGFINVATSSEGCIFI